MPKFKPILFNTEMVRAILEGRKTQTRRVIKPQPKKSEGNWGRLYFSGVIPYTTGDILWVRETWHKDAGRYMYRANYADDEKFYRDGKEVQLRWSPSIHMPKEAARIFLRVKDVRVERLQAITDRDAEREGVSCFYPGTHMVVPETMNFIKVWDSTIKPADRDRYGWNANPWVWVIEFERIEKPAHCFLGVDKS